MLFGECSGEKSGYEPELKTESAWANALVLPLAVYASDPFFVHQCPHSPYLHCPWYKASNTCLKLDGEG